MSINQTTVADVLQAAKEGRSIPVNDICAAAGVSGSSRADLERRVEAAGYVYVINYDAFMPPDWVDWIRRSAVA